MPIYEYECGACGKRFEAVQKMSEDPISVCPSCGDSSQVIRLVSASAFHLKGSGWYKTDYGSSGSAGTATSSDSTQKSSESTKETAKSTDTKPSTPSSSSTPD